MEKEDILLGVEMEKLEIEPVKLNVSRSSVNPFTNDFKKTNVLECQVFQEEAICTCSAKKKKLFFGITKKRHNKILKEPILKLLKSYGNVTEVEEHPKSLETNITPSETFDPLNLCTLVRNCNQLKISTSTNEHRCVVPINKSNSKWWKQESCSTLEHKEARQHSTQAGSCSQQALNPPCDVTIDELASYFETLVHIPKKMSSMAEMMYI